MTKALLTFLALMALSVSSWAGTTTEILPLGIRPLPLSSIVTAVSVDCSWPQGQVIATYAASGGNGNPITWAISGDTTDFGLSTTSGNTTNIIVKPSTGITSTVCGTTVNITVTATQ